MRLAAQHTCLLHSEEVDSFPQAMARQARQAGWVLKCEPGTQSNNRAICPGNAHIHLTEDKPVWEQIKENRGVEGEGEEVRGGQERKQRGRNRKINKCIHICACTIMLVDRSRREANE